jgi:hypothetical protein
MKCMCFYPEVDPTSEDGMCNCAHAMDEHNEDGDCQVEVPA